MKANNKFFMRSDNAQVGIGTLIIFIAMVLVAAVAAAVLIQTSGVLQQKAQTTGKEATREVSSNVAIDNIEGWRGGTQASSSSHDVFSNEIYRLDLRASLKVGSEAVDMNQAIITITDGTTTNDLRYIEAELTTQSANTTGIGDSNGTLGTKEIGLPSTVYAIRVNETSTDYAKFKKVYPDTNPDSDFNVSNYTDVLWSAPDNTGHAIAKNATGFDPDTYGGLDFFARADMFYLIDEIRDEDKSFTKGNPVMTKGDLVKIIVLTAPRNAAGNSAYGAAGIGSDPQLDNNFPYVGESDLTITPRSSISINIVPEGGANTQVDFVAPSSFGVKANVGLYP